MVTHGDLFFACLPACLSACSSVSLLAYLSVSLLVCLCVCLSLLPSCDSGGVVTVQRCCTKVNFSDKQDKTSCTTTKPLPPPPPVPPPLSAAPEATTISPQQRLVPCPALVWVWMQIDTSILGVGIQDDMLLRNSNVTSIFVAWACVKTVSCSDSSDWYCRTVCLSLCQPQFNTSRLWWKWCRGLTVNGQLSLVSPKVY